MGIGMCRGRLGGFMLGERRGEEFFSCFLLFVGLKGGGGLYTLSLSLFHFLPVSCPVFLAVSHRNHQWLIQPTHSWKSPTNIYRTAWNVQAIPCLVRYERVDGEIREVGRLVEGELLDEARVRGFVRGG